MRVLSLKIKHDCTIGTRCEEFKCISFSISLGHWEEKGWYYTSERHTIEGERVKEFLKDLKKDKRIINLEIDNITVFFTSRAKGDKIPTYFYSPKIFFVKPVFVDKNGFEYWEVASYDKTILDKFIEAMQSENYDFFEIIKYKEEKLNNIYFPAIAPNLSPKQKLAFNLAVEKGYYDIPKRTHLITLARLSKVALSTFQEHLKRAEAKIIPKFSRI